MTGPDPHPELVDAFRAEVADRPLQGRRRRFVEGIVRTASAQSATSGGPAGSPVVPMPQALDLAVGICAQFATDEPPPPPREAEGQAGGLVERLRRRAAELGRRR